MSNEILKRNFSEIGGTSINVQTQFNPDIFGHEFGTFAQSLFFHIMSSYSSLFKWENLPEGMTSQEIESRLFLFGRLKLIKVGRKYLWVRYVTQKWDYRGKAISSRIVEPWLPKLNGKSPELFQNVEIWNDLRGVGVLWKIRELLNNLDQTYESLMSNVRLLSGKAVYMTNETNSGDDDMQTSMHGGEYVESQVERELNAWFQNGNAVKALTSDMTSNGDLLPVVPLQFQDSISSFIETSQHLMNQLLNIIGIESNNVEGKKERLITDEIEIQNRLQNQQLDTMLAFRRNAVDEINSLFGLNITINVNDLSEVKNERTKDTELSENIKP